MSYYTDEEQQRKMQRLRLERGKRVLAQKAGQTKAFRKDGYVNMLNKYGTAQDNSTAYNFQADPTVPDIRLTESYEFGGLFAKIIDTPAEEAVKHGFTLGLSSPDVENHVTDMLEWLDWEEKAATSIKWTRLYGGSLIVMLIDDGRGLDEPLDWDNIKGIDELRVYERAIVQPDLTSLYDYDPVDPARRTQSRFGMPEFYYVFSIFGSFTVHESRCLVMRNGVLPERTTHTYYRFWGTPEYLRIQKELRETITSHSLGVKMLDRAVQAIYKMKNLAQLLATDEGEEQVLKRLQVIDMARGILNSIAIDNDGEDYDFKNVQLTGIKDVIDSTCNMLSAVTNIPQTVLFGASPTGENSTGESDMENYYNFVERIQKMMLKGNLKTLIDVIVRAAQANGKIDSDPEYRLEFNPLWSLTDKEQAEVDQIKANTAQVKAQTSQMYVDMGALDPSEVRSGLAKEEEYIVEELLDDKDEDDLWGLGGDDEPGLDEGPAGGSAATLVLRDGKILVGERKDGGGWCGPGGHAEDGESPEETAARELLEEFGISAGDLLPMGTVEGLDAEYGAPAIFLCDNAHGEPIADGDEIANARFVDLAELEELPLFPPFEASVRLLLEEVAGDE